MAADAARWLSAVLAAIGLLAGCGGLPATPVPAASAAKSVTVRLIGFNDFHGNLQPPRMSISAPGPDGATIAVPAGGAAHLATAIAQLKAEQPNHVVVSAGDLIGASPLISALFLDEPTIETFNQIGMDFLAVGNHEFDKGVAELLRVKHGGCQQHTRLKPCRMSGTFAGANFGFLAGNTVTADGGTLFPATAIKTFSGNGAEVKVGFIGLTLKGTAEVVTPSGVSGLTFRDEADTVRELVPALRAQGVNTIVVVLHEGGYRNGGYKSCEGISGAILPIVARLHPAVDVVISGHTHRAYICEFAKPGVGRGDAATLPLLLTSAGQYGQLLTVIDMDIDTASGRLVRRSADNVIVQGEGFGTDAGAGVAPSDHYPKYASDPAVAQLVARYAEAVRPLVDREVGRITASISRRFARSREHELGNFIADAELAATQAADKGGAQIAFMNPGGVRADLTYTGTGAVTYGELFRVQPFGNTLVVKTFTGEQIRRLLEQQFASGGNTVSTPRVLFPSQGFSYAYDLTRPAGQRISDMRLHGQSIVATQPYRVTMNSFLAAGGDNFSVFKEGSMAVAGDLDVEALEAYVTGNSPLRPPGTDRIRRLD